MTAAYLDSSAAVKLVLDEPESAALRQWLGQSDSTLLSSYLLRVELMRSAVAWGSRAVSLARFVVSRVHLVAIDNTVVEAAGHLGSPSLRSLDAIHLATALQHVRFARALVTYDRRLADACRAHGVAVVSPGIAD